MNKHIVPVFGAEAFNCPHCGAYAHQKWQNFYPLGHIEEKNAIYSSVCVKCETYAIWFRHKMISPSHSAGPLPLEDMPEDVKGDFEEARDVLSLSPRSASALLRLALQKLMVKIGEKGENLNKDIGNLVNKGLPLKIQKALDSVRVIGNNAVHPGQIDLRDDVKTATALFNLVNIIVDFEISQEKKVNAIYDKLPETSREQIKKRNGPA